MCFKHFTTFSTITFKYKYLLFVFMQFYYKLTIWLYWRHQSHSHSFLWCSITDFCSRSLKVLPWCLMLLFQSLVDLFPPSDWNPFGVSHFGLPLDSYKMDLPVKLDLNYFLQRIDTFIHVYYTIHVLLGKYLS